jgi:hypothetical protein
MGKNRIPGKFTSSKMDNYKSVVDAASEVVYHIVGSGVDTATNIYFDFGRPAEKVTIRATVQCSIIEVNGYVCKSPITINAGANNLDLQVSRFKLATTAQSVIEVTIK